MKADAANYLFNIDTSDLAWAVIDGGIDAQHPAFINRKAVEGQFKQQEAKRRRPVSQRPKQKERRTKQAKKIKARCHSRNPSGANA